jgi:hypothetical protein
MVVVYGVQRHIHQYFSYITTVSFIGGGKQSTRRNHPLVASNLVRLNRGRRGHDRVVVGFPSPIIMTATIWLKYCLRMALDTIKQTNKLKNFTLICV